MKFFRKMYQKSKEQKGFTLVEMIVVLVIIAILAAITIPALLKYIDKAKDKQVVINARTAYLAAETAASEAYAAGDAIPSGSAIVFDNSKTNTATVEGNANSLAGITKTYSCTAKVDSNWKITEVIYTEGSKKASLNLSSTSTDWKVESK